MEILDEMFLHKGKTLLFFDNAHGFIFIYIENKLTHHNRNNCYYDQVKNCVRAFITLDDKSDFLMKIVSTGKSHLPENAWIGYIHFALIVLNYSLYKLSTH